MDSEQIYNQNQESEDQTEVVLSKNGNPLYLTKEVKELRQAMARAQKKALAQREAARTPQGNPVS